MREILGIKERMRKREHERNFNDCLELALEGNILSSSIYGIERCRINQKYG